MRLREWKTFKDKRSLIMQDTWLLFCPYQFKALLGNFTEQNKAFVLDRIYPSTIVPTGQAQTDADRNCFFVRPKLVP